jgi:hypothetical protein
MHGIRNRRFMGFHADVAAGSNLADAGRPVLLLAVKRQPCNPMSPNSAFVTPGFRKGSAFMNGIPRAAPIQVDLEAGSIIVLPDELDVEVCCKSGLLWVAQLDNPNDLAIVAGGSMLIAKGKHSIVNAIEAASLEIHMAAHKHSRLIWKLSRNCHASDIQSHRR